MRKEFVAALMEYADNPKFVFFTGDLGYKALEPLQAKMGKRFINAGIAEQNMVGVAAGLASCGDRPWCYSIAPFLYKRAFEFISNDVCEPDLPVMLVGNGGGYGYGVMGPSHHAINDYGILSTLHNLRIFCPIFDEDIPAIIAEMMVSSKPCYLRLGVDESPDYYTPAEFALWRQLVAAKSDVAVIVIGSIAGSYIAALRDVCDLWAVSAVAGPIPTKLYNNYRKIIIVEEHVSSSFAFGLALQLQNNYVTHRGAEGYASGLYGSKEFHRKESGLDPESIVTLVKSL